MFFFQKSRLKSLGICGLQMSSHYLGVTTKAPIGQDKVCWAGSKLKMWHNPRQAKQIPIQNERCVKVKGEILKIQNGIPILRSGSFNFLEWKLKDQNMIEWNDLWIIEKVWKWTINWQVHMAKKQILKPLKVWKVRTNIVKITFDHSKSGKGSNCVQFMNLKWC